MLKENIYIIYELLKSINKNIHRQIGSKLGFKDVNPSAMALLFVLSDGEARTLKEISETLGLANSTVSGIIDKLVDKDLVQRVQDKKDRRKVMISITGRAKDMHCAAEGELKEFFARVLKRANEEDLKLVYEGLTKLNEIIKESVNQ